MKVENEWKILGNEHQLNITVDDEDSEAVAKMMLQMDPATLEQLKSDPRLPPKTLQLYEELKAQSAR